SLGGGSGVQIQRGRSASTAKRTLVKRKMRRIGSGLHTSLRRLQPDQLSTVRRHLVSTILKAMHHFDLLCNLGGDTGQPNKPLLKTFNILGLLESDQSTQSSPNMPKGVLYAKRTSPAGRPLVVPCT